MVGFLKETSVFENLYSLFLFALSQVLEGPEELKI